MNINAYCLDWHITQSDAFKEFLIKPLKPFVDIKLISRSKMNTVADAGDRPIIFCMLPPEEGLLHQSKLKIVWIPMWDQAQVYSNNWWYGLPKNLRIVAFSNEVYKRANDAGLKVIQLKYFVDPNSVTPSKWDKGHVLLYWNRVGMIGPNFIKKLCESLDIKILMFKPDIDPRISKDNYYTLPRRIGNTEVVTIPNLKRKPFLKFTEQTNIVIAPRLFEGVGMVFLEAMSRGSCVIAHNAPTMNEYISDGQNGVLLDRSEPHKVTIKERLGLQKYSFLFNDNQPWSELSGLDYQELGQKARENCIVGYKKWRDSLDKYASFILDWK